MEVMPIENLKASFALVQTLIKEIFVEDTHFGTIPGTKKPTMYKPGADVVSTAMRCRPEYDDTEKDLGNGHREVVSRCRLIHIGTGEYVGEGGGSCSTMESRYRYRKSYEDTGVFVPKPYFDSMRANKYREAEAMKPSKKHEAKKNEAGKWTWHLATGLAENTDLADVWNTILKMAHKRAKVDAVISSFGLAGVFDQDIEDLPDYLKDGAIEAEFSVVTEGTQQQPGLSPEEITKIRVDFAAAIDTIVSEEFPGYAFPEAVFEGYAAEAAKSQGKQDYEIMQLASASPEHVRSFINMLIKNKGFKPTRQETSATENGQPQEKTKGSTRSKGKPKDTSGAPPQTNGATPPPPQERRSDGSPAEYISTRQAYDIALLLKQYPGTEVYGMFHGRFGIDKIPNLPSDKFTEALCWLHDKAAQDGTDLIVPPGCEDPRKAQGKTLSEQEAEDFFSKP